MSITVNFGKRMVPIVLAGLLASGSALASSDNHDGPPSQDDLVEQGLPSTSPDGGLQEPSSDPGEPRSSQSSPPSTTAPKDASDHDAPADPVIDDGESGRTAGTSLAKAIIADYRARKSAAEQPQDVNSVTGIPGDQMLEGLIHGNGEPGADGNSARSTGSGSHGSDGSAEED